jgi:hypothetical protein
VFLGVKDSVWYFEFLGVRDSKIIKEILAGANLTPTLKELRLLICHSLAWPELYSLMDEVILQKTQPFQGCGE